MVQINPYPQEQAVPGLKALSPRARLCIAILELVFIAGLLLVWVLSDSVRESKNLWIFFFYNFPSQFLIAVVSHEPVLLYFSKFYAPLTVTLVGIAGTLITEAMNYSCFGYFADSSVFDRIRENRLVVKLTVLFNKMPFAALWIAGFTPIPFYPFRFLVVLARYPLWKYLLAVFLSRTPRFYLLALFGNAFPIPDVYLIVFFGAVAVLLNLPFIRSLWKHRDMAPTER
jgi:membrane protein YqaA with SNARE-associated domain